MTGRPLFIPSVLYDKITTTTAASTTTITDVAVRRENVLKALRMEAKRCKVILWKPYFEKASKAIKKVSPFLLLVLLLILSTLACTVIVLHIPLAILPPPTPLPLDYDYVTTLTTTAAAATTTTTTTTVAIAFNTERASDGGSTISMVS